MHHPRVQLALDTFQVGKRESSRAELNAKGAISALQARCYMKLYITILKHLN